MVPDSRPPEGEVAASEVSSGAEAEPRAEAPDAGDSAPRAIAERAPEPARRPVPLGATPSEPAASAPGERLPPRSGERLAALRARALDVRTLAGLLLAITLYDRGVAPALRGIAVGYDRFTNRAGFAAEVTAVTLLVTTLLVIVVQSIVLMGSRVHLAVRLPGFMLLGLTALVALAAPSAPRPPFVLLVAGSGASAALALLASASAIAKRFERPVAVALLLSCLATAARVAAVVVADRAASHPRGDGPELARVIATVSFGLEALLLVIATVWIASRNRRVALALVGGALIAAFFVTRSIVEDTSNTHPIAVILRIGARELLSRPVPLVPYYAETFVVVLGPLLALAAILVPKEVGTSLGALAIVLVVRGSGEIPLYAASIAAASAAMLLRAGDPRLLWASLGRVDGYAEDPSPSRPRPERVDS